MTFIKWFGNPETAVSKLRGAGLRLIYIACLSFFMVSCTSPNAKEIEGFIDVADGRVWYKIVGSGDKIPLLLLHGGPGFSSHYLNPLKGLSNERPVIFYDQLGAGRSDKTDDPALWTIDHFVAELATLREALGLKEVHILGHSWGSQLALDYMLTKPSGVKSLILASPAINVHRWTEAAQAAIEKHEREGTTDSDEYQSAMMVFYRRHISRSNPWSDDLNLAFETSNQDIYGYMWGASDWAATGTLKNYDREYMLPSLNLPVLFTTGRYDEARPDTVAHFQSLVPNARLAILENSAHITMQDEPEEYNRIVREFLNNLP